MPDKIGCFAVPINQTGKAEYDRALNPGDVVLTKEEWVTLKKYQDELFLRADAVSNCTK